MEAMKARMAAQRRLVEQLTLFLQLRRRGWRGLQTFLDESHLPRPAFSLLRALEGETVRGQALTLQQMRIDLFNPYAARFPILDHLPLLVERGYLQQEGAGYVVTDTGRLLSDQIEMAARAYIGSLETSSALASPGLAQSLIERVHAAWQAPEPAIKAHQARTQRRLSVTGAPPLVQIEWAVLGLWEARDDAHIAAWRARHFSGSVFDILTHVWSKEVQTVPNLISMLEASQEPIDIQRGVRELIKSGYVLIVEDQIELTQQGQKIRDAIESETDRIFFASWDRLADDEVTWLSKRLSDLCSYFREHI